VCSGQQVSEKSLIFLLNQNVAFIQWPGLVGGYVCTGFPVYPHFFLRWLLRQTEFYRLSHRARPDPCSKRNDEIYFLRDFAGWAADKWPLANGAGAVQRP
jgi:hypothetical protein